ncbi:CCR4 [Symbiodinium natans]|uniref:CCR4 protein n=1 Tax=Symbiodinium natans TaxID=878477 RepID=A0A812TF68_9DINO|nr:CCR4 [Symbiodinium natans]
MRIGFLLAALPLPLAERTRFIANEGLEFPQSCESGLLELNGIYEISARVKFEKSCTLRGSPGTSIELAQQLLVLGDLTLEGHLQITASAENDDTCLVVPTGILTIATDELVISRCTSFGSITAQNLHIRGHMQILDSYSARDGGGIRVLESVVQHTGILTFANCSSKRSGGAVHVQGSYEQLGGSASFVNCTSGDESDVEAASQDTKTDGGGGLSVGEMFRQQGGVMRFEACRSIFNGGGLQVRVGKQPKLSVKLLQAGRMSFSACAAGRRGGGASVNGPVQLKGSMVFDACKAGLGPGGGLHVSDFMELSGSLTATSCSAGLEDGGGLHVAHGLRQTAGSMRFYNCSTVKKGGGIKVARGGMKLTGGDRSFDNCSAGVSGGGLYVHYEGVQLIGSISFRSCSAKREGGAAFVQYGGFHQSSEALQDSVSCLNCSAGSRSGALYVGGSASFSSPVLLSQCRDSSSTPFAVAGPLELRYVHISEKGEQHACITADAMNVSKANCTSAGQCEFTSKQPNVSRLLCKQGRGRTDDVSQGSVIPAHSSRLSQSHPDLLIVLAFRKMSLSR